MNTRLEKIIEQYKPHFKGWIDKFNNHAEMINSFDNFNEQERIDIVIKVVNALSSLADIYFKYGNFKDKFEYDNFYQQLYGPEIVIISNKTGTTYKLGIDNKGVYISSYLEYAENIKNMDDEFWANILTLSKHKGFELVGLEHVNNKTKSKYPELSYNYKGTIFKIFRRYFFNITEYDKTMDDYGEFKITWESGDDFEKTVREGCEIFKMLYKLNYSLWKIEDLKKKEELKRG